MIIIGPLLFLAALLVVGIINLFVNYFRIELKNLKPFSFS
jgi:hypothetical protein